MSHMASFLEGKMVMDGSQCVRGMCVCVFVCVCVCVGVCLCLRVCVCLCADDATQKTHTYIFHITTHTNSPDQLERAGRAISTLPPVERLGQASRRAAGSDTEEITPK